jgi:polar amino acid transport system substrate-binding protein
MKIILLVGLTSCVFPKDPENSFEEASRDKLLVGVVENPPFTKVEDSTYTGNEVEMLRKFAEHKGLQIKFEEGSESKLVKQLEEYETHVVIGGFTKKTIWKKKAGMTVPYDKEHVFLISKGENRLLKHLEDFIFQQKKQQL